MALIGTGMHCNAVGTEELTVLGNLEDIRIVTSAGIPDGCDLVDVYT
jgi:hypothetical protein